MPENPNLDKLAYFDQEFPENVCINDLCDCGHHKCIHKPIQQEQRGPFPKSDYMSTYQAIQHPKPRSSKRPLAQVRVPCIVPMYFSTNQRDDFINHGNVQRVQPISNIQKYEPSTEPLDGLTLYSQEFTAKQINSEPIEYQIDTRDLIQPETGKFNGTTMNKEQFKRWVSEPRIHFGELQSFTGPLLFPDKDRMPQSTMKQSYIGAHAPSTTQIQAACPDNIKLEGEQYFDTTHNKMYRKIEGDHRVKPIIHSDDTPLRRQGQFVGITQSQHDFPGYQGKQPSPPKPVDPLLPTIDFKFDNKQSFTTENRTIFQGHDVRKHPVRKSCKIKDEEYKLPAVKVETETSQKRDYQPIDLKTIDNINIKIPATSIELAKDSHFDGKTMNNEFFQNWRVKPRIRYGDFHENRLYIPPKDPFNAQSITRTSFIPRPADRTRTFYPEQSPMFTDGKMSFTTEYQEVFQKKQARLCRAQVYLMQRELRRRKADQQQLSQRDNQKCSSACHTGHIMAPGNETVA